MTTGLPPTQLNFSLSRAGQTWDAIEVAAVVGRKVIKELGDACGGVTLDEKARMTFFVSPGTAAALHDLPGVTVHGRDSYVYVPSEERTTPPGLHWKRSPEWENRLTPAEQLHAALRKVL